MLNFQLKQFDGRRITLSILVIYFASLVIAGFFVSHHQFLRSLGVPALLTPFRDLEVVSAAWDCHLHGYDVLTVNDCYPFSHPMNYPRAWMIFTMLGLRYSHTVPLAILIILLFLSSIWVLVGQLNLSEGIFYGIVLCSPSIILAIERCNNDLIIFILFIIFALWVNLAPQTYQIYAYSILLAAAMLKLYPIVSFTASLREKNRLSGCILGVASVIFFAYLLLIWEDVKVVNVVTPRVTTISYGSLVIFDRLLLPDRLFFHLGEFGRRLGYDSIRLLLGTVAVLLTAAPASLLALRQATQASTLEPSQPNQPDEKPQAPWRVALTLDCFRIGASVYLGTFVLLGNNWDYRLIFLILVLPQLFAWSQANSKLKYLARSNLVAIAFTVWWSRWSWFNLDEAANWFILGSLVYTLVLTLPASLKQFLTREFGRSSSDPKIL